VTRFLRCISIADLLGDHVDILGRASLNDLILRIAAGRAEDVEDTIFSKILEYAERVKIYEEEAWT
jgi:phospholipid:diacylglycerol acyltransferase